jgi:hypothetical protein
MAFAIDNVMSMNAQEQQMYNKTRILIYQPQSILVSSSITVVGRFNQTVARRLGVLQLW